ncbi:MAG TPA: hypothetical protein VGR89_02730 [Puia sp.]|nr:hypothetical protein [Puia sp.]
MIIQKISLLAISLTLMVAVAAGQEHMPRQINTYTDAGNGNGFLRQNLFAGGGLDLGLADYQFNIGVNPEIGYSLNRWLDAGVVVNFNYVSVSPDPYGNFNPDLSEKEFVYGGGVFARAFFLPFLFATVQPEYNWTHDKQKYEQYGTQYTYTFSAASLLCGIGYAHRVVGDGTFYLALMFDVLGNQYSPYNDPYGHPLPVIRAGFDFYVHKH